MDYLLKLKVDNEEHELKEPYDKCYEALCSTVHWQLFQAENIDFELETAEVVFKFEYFFKYFKKHFNYNRNQTSTLIVELMKAELVEMGCRRENKDGK